MGVAKLDANSRPTLTAVSSSDSSVIVPLYADPTTHRLLVDSAAGAGTVTSISQGTGILLTPSPITTTGSVALATSLQPLASLAGNALKFVRVNAGETAVEYASALTTLTVGATTVTSGTTTRILYDNAGVLGEYTITGSGTVVAMQTSPTFATSITGSYLTASQILITDGSKNIISADTATYPSLTELSYVKGVTSAIQTQINAKGSGTVTAVSIATANGFSGSSSGGATPALTIVAGAIVPTSVNGLTISTTTGTFTLTNGKTLSVAKSITLDGTDSTTMTFPSTSASVARTDAAQTFTGAQTFSNALIYTNNAITASGNAATVPVTAKLNTVTNNSAATLTITMTTASATDGQMTIVRVLDSSAAAQTITWVNTENSTVTVPTTSNGSTTLFKTVGFIYNAATSKWRCIASA